MKVLCADIGGTSSKFRIYQNDQIIDSYHDKPFNCSGKKREEIAEFISKHIKQDCKSHVFGFAGIEKMDSDFLSDPSKGLHITHDLELARYDAFQNSDGLVLIIGTGMILSGKIHGKQIKHAGNGFLLDRASGGFRLGQLFLQELLLQIARGDKTEFLDLALEKRKQNKEEFRNYCRLSYLSENVVKEIASNSEILIDLFSTGNLEASLLVKTFLDELNDYLSIKTDSKIELAFHGSLFKNEKFKHEVIKMIDQHNSYIISNKAIDPIRGAYRIAKEHNQ
jgi:N-acetylglucosamine kinase-like BadF-type ATPase